jgi:hypothetical protein
MSDKDGAWSSFDQDAEELRRRMTLSS